MAAQLRDDGTLPIRARVFALQAAHGLSIGGTVTLESEHQLRQLHFQRRPQLAALGKLWR